MTKERFFEIAEEEGFGFDAEGMWERGNQLSPDLINEANVRSAFQLTKAVAPGLYEVVKNYAEKKAKEGEDVSRAVPSGASPTAERSQSEG
jgi:hypothetical protein